MGPIGIDVEWAQPERTSPEELIRFMIDPSLWPQVEIDDKADFYRLWTVIESIIKAKKTLPPISLHTALLKKPRLPSLERMVDGSGMLWIAQARLVDYAIGLAVNTAGHERGMPQIHWPTNTDTLDPVRILKFHPV
jgi:hypothetical protein